VRERLVELGHACNNIAVRQREGGNCASLARFRFLLKFISL
jgi:hypothetical protein